MWRDLRRPPDELLQEASNDNPRIRESAAEDLKNYIHPVSVEILVALTDDNVCEVRREALRSLSYICGQKETSVEDVSRVASIFTSFLISDSSEMQWTALWHGDPFVDEERYLESLIGFLRKEACHPSITRNDTVRMERFRELLLGVEVEYNRDYVIRELVGMGLNEIYDHTNCIELNLAVLQVFNPSRALEHANIHLSGLIPPGKYGRGRHAHDNYQYVVRIASQTVAKVGEAINQDAPAVFRARYSRSVKHLLRIAKCRDRNRWNRYVPGSLEKICSYPHTKNVLNASLLQKLVSWREQRLDKSGRGLH